MNLPSYLDNLIHSISSALPGVLGAILVFVVGWLIALLIRRVVHGLMKRTEWDERLLGNTIVDTNKFIANLVYYVLMVIILLIVLEMLGVSYVLDPIKNMLSEFLGFIPNILAGMAIVFIGYIIAKFISNLVKMAGSFFDRLAKGMGFKETEKFVYFIQQLVFVVVFIPFIIQGLNALELEAITRPANNILHDLLDAVPNIIGAALIITIFIVGGRFITAFLKDLLSNMGTDNLTEKLQLKTMLGENATLSAIVANIAFFFLVFFGIISSIEMLGFERLTHALHSILNLSGSILFGLMIMIIGNFLASIIFKALNTSEDSRFVAGITRVAIIGLFLAIALRTMGIANSIVELAFGLTLGSLAVTVALSYGLGGREAAGKHMEKILKRFQKEK
ncbi:MAG: mechanosensitive ion channel [Cyclobacteriaceae bacterium]|nr:mechanosensitive ion channel [Cyclobacteriaceae bacterium HetDA_MAG_MS6]